MSMEDFERAAALLAKHPGYGDYVGPCPLELVTLAEQALGLTFPPTYRQFVRRYGAGSFGEEIYGVTSAEFVNDSIPNAIWLTLKNRRQFGLPAHYIEIGSSGEGSGYFINTSQTDRKGECPIVTSSNIPEVDTPTEIIADDFGQFFLESVTNLLHDAKKI